MMEASRLVQVTRNSIIGIMTMGYNWCENFASLRT